MSDPTASVARMEAAKAGTHRIGTGGVGTGGVGTGGVGTGVIGTGVDASSAGDGNAGPVVAAGLTMGEDGLIRCAWADSTPEYRVYHDEEWGRSVRSDDGIYERMTLEAFQSGLAWITILRKRPAFRAAFADFSIARVATF